MTQILLTSTALACAATSIYAARCYIQISSIPPSQITSSDALSDDFKTSKAVALTNPNKHIPINDSRRITINLPSPLSDEQILARFVKGFFGGWWLGPERTVLCGFGKVLVDYKDLNHKPISKSIWSASHLSRQIPPPLDALLFGAFRVVDYYIADPHSGGESYIDFVFGSDTGRLAGVHRFCVSSEQSGERQGVVTIEFAHSGCNPGENKRLSPAVLECLHMWYGMVLFREGVAEVLRS
ncbi:hypothetical protein BKA63DRAFT_503220 [Paraphoma chrysanthemicola]|nr:hypothetical protein BKA63DRAFT_503220 [Paraphoma chrysanthemicola]